MNSVLLSYASPSRGIGPSASRGFPARTMFAQRTMSCAWAPGAAHGAAAFFWKEAVSFEPSTRLFSKHRAHEDVGLSSRVIDFFGEFRTEIEVEQKREINNLLAKVKVKRNWKTVQTHALSNPPTFCT